MPRRRHHSPFFVQSLLKLQSTFCSVNCASSGAETRRLALEQPPLLFSSFKIMQDNASLHFPLKKYIYIYKKEGHAMPCMYVSAVRSG